MLQADPRYVVWLKKEPGQLLDTASIQYKALFSPSVSAFELANAVKLNRYVQNRMLVEEAHAAGRERLAYKHGAYAVAWVLSKRVRMAVAAPVLFSEQKLTNELSAPFDALRQTYWEKTKTATAIKGPLSVFRSQSDTLPLVQAIAIENFGLTADPVVKHKIAQQTVGQPYPEDLFAYLVAKAPQIGGLA